MQQNYKELEHERSKESQPNQLYKNEIIYS